MGSISRSILISACILSTWGAWPLYAGDIDVIKAQINSAENELLDSAAKHEKASVQIKKIRKLLALQKKEITLTATRIETLNKSLGSLSDRKKELEGQVVSQKRKLQHRVRLIQSLVENTGDEGNSPALDALWISKIDLENERSYYLIKSFRKNFSEVKKLKVDMAEVGQLESRIIKEKAELEYFAQELKEKNDHLVSNEKMQKEIMLVTGPQRLEQFSRVKMVKDSERELKKMLVSRTVAAQQEADADHRLAALKGKLPYPAQGPIVSGYGRFYDVKTSLLTFQKGISIGAFADTDVKVVASGKVVYSGALKNYGLMVIVEHPGQFYTLYGHLGKTTVKEGDSVELGRLLGRTSTAGTPLYFEIRDRNIAINPLQWLQNASITLNK